MRGEIPLGELLLEIQVGVAGGAQSTPPADDEWGVLRLSAITSDSYSATDAKRMTAHAAEVTKLELKARDVLMIRVNGAQHLVGATGCIKQIRQRLVLSDLMYRLVPCRDRATPEFLALALGSLPVRRQIVAAMRGSSGQFQLPKSEVRALTVPDVSLAEQRRIVTAHDAIERRITSLAEAGAKLGTVRRGIVDRLVAGPRMQMKSLLVRRPKNGYSPVEVPEWTGLLTLGLGCLTPDGFRPRQLKHIPKSDQAQRFVISDGDLLMSRANTRELVGLVGLYKDVGQPCIYPDLMMRLTPDPEICLPEYLELALRTPTLRRAVQAGARGTSESMVKISSELVESLDVPVPSLEAQRRAVRAVAALDLRIARQEERIEKLRVVQQGVTEDLLSGRVRAA
ncbi:hypothetical protein [Streptomyces sp. NPDC048606]|uniref:hypothetical protein n=1 Tax=Streptomyces sp. NPDC048606 TaxID=3154726 RepID=UPI00343216E8